MAEINPFRPTRFEHQEHPLIWLSPNVKLLEGLKSLYLAGTRGSGKTSLLKAVNWRERLQNQTLSDQINPDDVLPYIAVYFRIPDYVSGAISSLDWNKHFPNAPSVEILQAEFFSKLIEIISAQLICEAFAAVRAEGKFNYSTIQEGEVVKQFSSEHPNVFGRDSAPIGLDDMAVRLRFVQRRINTSIIRGEISQLGSLFPETTPGIFINTLAEKVRSLACDTVSHSCPPNFHIKVCVDDCEALQPEQQKYLNTLVRTSRHPLFWVVSYVSTEYDTTSTIINNQNLTDADRKQHNLNSEQEGSFRKLCEEVSSLRVYYSHANRSEIPKYRDLPTEFFKLDAVFGTRSINRLILDTIRNSLSSELNALVERAYVMRAALGEANVDMTNDDAPPIWETYVMEKFGIQANGRNRAGQKINLNAYLRRKQRAALLNLCSQFKISNVPYAGTNVIIAMSDLCVRDYLEIAGSILDNAIDRGEIKSFEGLTYRRAPLTVSAQREGIRSSSRSKFEGIKNNLEQDWVEVMKVIECLGTLCAKLQSDHQSLNSLSTPERGIFTFNLGALNASSQHSALARRAKIRKILQRCEADGLLRPATVRLTSLKHDDNAFSLNDDKSPNAVSYRLHRRFAALFKFSYRGPYEAIQVPMEEFALLCDEPQAVNTHEWVARTYARFTSSSQQSSLL